MFYNVQQAGWQNFNYYCNSDMWATSDNSTVATDWCIIQFCLLNLEAATSTYNSPN